MMEKDGCLTIDAGQVPMQTLVFFIFLIFFANLVLKIMPIFSRYLASETELDINSMGVKT